ncbi:LacI family transcriptional regulator [Streptococcus chenjunshii]|uniref:LacI family transcriptional regulator n=1 Tax=Streptococcus chenjunshii TaxID=2173853 RepID=A0A372KMS2_9STRE|nr:substrate-binding domain-containing protein [Streptococcus chenjunshii]AXQ78955.1 LacI family transcriptional regulator [Streptococcus chenjunshii]RFU51382.1 LacI family transcriptional regulator [Streptococcus chenjunshii]RFU53582.1 LacI family transcriptional regulator [Streptococcus chenjunshii]
MATIQDIADEVGISKAAVSRILNKKGSFSKETIQKVHQTAKNLGYTLPADLQAFEELDFKIIAAVLPLSNIAYYSILASYLEAAAYSYGYSLMICSSLFDSEKEEVLLDHLKARKINGIIYGSFTSDVVIDASLPVVTIGYQLNKKIPVVRSDNYMAGVLAAKHLFSKGCRNLLYISGYQVGKNKDERYKGFEETAKELGVGVAEYFTGFSERKKNIPSVISQMFIENPDADGLFAESYSLATKCLQVASDLGIDVPSKIKIIGYGNDNLSEYTCPKLSFIKENTEQIAQIAVAQLVEIIEGGQKTSESESIVPVSIEQNRTT